MDGIDAFLYGSYLLIILAAAAAVILPVIKSLDDPKALIKPVAGFVAILLVFLIGWGFSGSEVTPVYAEFGVDEGGSKMVGGMISSMYILLGLSLVGIVASEIKQLFFK